MVDLGALIVVHECSGGHHQADARRQIASSARAGFPFRSDTPDDRISGDLFHELVSRTIVRHQDFVDLVAFERDNQRRDHASDQVRGVVDGDDNADGRALLRQLPVLVRSGHTHSMQRKSHCAEETLGSVPPPRIRWSAPQPSSRVHPEQQRPESARLGHGPNLHG